MKMNKWFMLGMVGLAFTACSNEEDVTGGKPIFNGNGMVSVRIVKPSVTKALTPGASVDISGDITVTLKGKKTVDAQSEDYEETIVIKSGDLSGTTELKFWNVAVPTKLTASINGGQSSYTGTTITSTASDGKTPLWQVAPASAPAYGETTTFTPTEKEDTPTLTEDGKTEAGAEETDKNKVYSIYDATVTMAIPMARLEVGDITFEAPSTGSSIYKKLIYTGCYLDKYATNGGTYKIPADDQENDGKPYFTDTSVSMTENNYWFETDAGTVGQKVADLKYSAGADHNFITTKIDEAGSFNFYAGDKNPQFKLYFKTGEFATSVTGKNFPRYAIVTKYMKDGKEITLENGHIYQIKGVKLDDDNFIPDEEGNELFGVIVTVTEATWTVEGVDAVWAD